MLRFIDINEYFFNSFSGSATPEDQVIEAEEWEDIKEFVTTLDLRYLIVYYLREICGMERNLVSSLLGISNGSVNSKIKIIRGQIKLFIEKNELETVDVINEAITECLCAVAKKKHPDFKREELNSALAEIYKSSRKHIPIKKALTVALIIALILAAMTVVVYAFREPILDFFVVKETDERIDIDLSGEEYTNEFINEVLLPEYIPPGYTECHSQQSLTRVSKRWDGELGLLEYNQKAVKGSCILLDNNETTREINLAGHSVITYEKHQRRLFLWQIFNTYTL